MKITCKQFKDLIDNNDIRPGDLICVKKGELGIIGKMIEKIQYKLLLDLNSNMNNDIAKEFATFTHTAIIVDSNMIAEMYRPKGRLRNFEDLFSNGCELIVKRPSYLDVHDTYETRGDKISNMAMGVVRKEPPYPFSELFYYYFWSWRLNKLIFGRNFIEIFKNTQYNVCSGFCWEMFIRGDAIDLNKLTDQDLFPESWYPARLTFDAVHFEVVGVFEILN